MKRKLIGITLIILLIASMVLTGCSKNESAETPVDSKENTEENTEEAETSEEPAETEDAGSEEMEGTEESETVAPIDVNVMALKGPTAMGMVQMMDAVDKGEISSNIYHFNLAASPDEVPPAIAQGTVDIAAVPANLASVLYNKTEGQVQVLAINTLGVLYIVENGETVKAVEDLKGRTIYASGKGATPEFALNYILKGNGIDPASDVTIEWKSEHAECLSALMADESGIAMLPQPFVTTAQTKSEGLKVVLDLTEEWDKLQENEENPSALITGVVIARKAFIEENPNAVEDFMNHYYDSVLFVNSNVDEAAALVGAYDIVPEEVAVKALPKCNITFVEGSDMEQQLSGYLAILAEGDPASVGGAVPGDDFYYKK